MRHLSTTSPEWARLWEVLADAAGDYAEQNPENYEVWQYMGSAERYYQGRLIAVHQLRHRDRPKHRPAIKGFVGADHSQRVYVDVSASQEWASGEGVYTQPQDGERDGMRLTRLSVQRYEPRDEKPTVVAPVDWFKQPQHQTMTCPRCGGNHPLVDCSLPDREQFEANCGGVFDGFSVTSDADPGL